MPGIVGILGNLPKGQGDELLAVMLQAMRHERSYTCQHFSFENGFHIGWIAHPDSQAATESIHDEHAGVTLAFAGEHFGGCSAITEESPRNLVHHYGTGGINFLRELNGLFSGIMVDHKRRLMYVFNDRYGMERIYFHRTPTALCFASEAKALLAISPSARRFDDYGVAEYLALGCTTAPRTLFRGVSLLPNASVWELHTANDIKQRQYFTPSEWEKQIPLGSREYEDAFAELFPRIVSRYLRNSRRVGIALTGGLDTRMIMACVRENTRPISTYTFCGKSARLKDAQIAARVAAVCGLPHSTIPLGSDFISEYGTFVDRSIYITDGYCGANGAHELYFNKKAARLAPVRLTGNYGSEVLRSVSTFKPLRLSNSFVSPDYWPDVEAAGRKDHSDNPVTFAAFEEIPFALAGTVLSSRSQVTFRTPYLDNDLVKLAYRAPIAIRISPQTALRFVSQTHPPLSKVPTDRGLSIGPNWRLMMRRMWAEATFKLDYYHKEGLPGCLQRFTPVLSLFDSIGLVDIHKYLPYSKWFQHELSSHVQDVLSTLRQSPLPYLAQPELIVKQHIRRHSNYNREINMLLTLEATDRLLIRHHNPRSAILQ